MIYVQTTMNVESMQSAILEFVNVQKILLVIHIKNVVQNAFWIEIVHQHVQLVFTMYAKILVLVHVELELIVIWEV